jgi:hypothetical protein
VAVRSKARVCGRSLAGIAGSNFRREHEYLCLVSVVGCQVEVSTTDRSLIQRCPTDSVCARARVCVCARGREIQCDQVQQQPFTPTMTT